MLIRDYINGGKPKKDGLGVFSHRGILKVYKGKTRLYHHTFIDKKQLKSMLKKMQEMYGECEISVMFEDRTK